MKRIARTKVVVVLLVGAAALSTLTACGENGKVTTSYETTN